MSKSIRCFLGVPVEPAVGRVLDSAVTALQRLPARQQVNWVAPANRHLTLAFLGNQPLTLAYQLQAELQGGLSQLHCFTLPSTVVSGFPDKKSPIVALQFEAAGALLDLMKVITPVLERLGLPVERRPLRPHITLGRLRRGQGWLHPGQAMILSLPVTSLVLYESRLSPGGAHYTPLWSLPLAPA